MKNFFALALIIMLATGILLAAELEKAGNKAANEGDALFNDSKFAEAAAKYQVAYQKYTEALKKKEIPSNEKIITAIQNAYASYEKAGNYQEAANWIDKWITVDPKSSKRQALILRKAQLLDKYLNNTAEAVKVLETENQANPSLRLIKKIAVYYDEKNLNNKTKALEWYKKAYDAKPDDKVIQRIASLHIDLGNKQEAIKAYESYLATKPSKRDKSRTYRNMGKLYEDLKDEAKAIEYYEKCVETNYDKAVALVLAQKYAVAKQWNKAEAMSRKVLSKSAGNAYANYSLGEALYNQNKKKEAKPYFEKVVNDATYGVGAKKYLEIIGK